MMIELTMSTAAAFAGVISSVGAAAGYAFTLYGNSKWAQRQSLHNLSNDTAVSIAALGKEIAKNMQAQQERILALEIEHKASKESLARLENATREQMHDIRAIAKDMSDTLQHVSQIAGEWKEWRRRNGPLNMD